MNRVLLAASLALAVSACGRTPMERELGMVPGTALLHIHVESTLPPEFWAFVPEGALPLDEAFFRELLERGPLGISLASVSLTDLSPQLLVLTRDIRPDSMLSILAAHGEFRAESLPERTDLYDPRGSTIGSVAARDGWTCLYLGPAPQTVMQSWSDMEREGSLAADTALALVREADADLSVLVPSGLLAFLRVAPVASWVPGWGDVEDAMAMLQPSAARLDLSFGGSVAVEARMVRQQGNVTRVRFELEDTGFTPGELLASLNLLLSAGGLL